MGTAWLIPCFQSCDTLSRDVVPWYWTSDQSWTIKGCFLKLLKFVVTSYTAIENEYMIKLMSHLYLILVNGHSKKEEWANSYSFWYISTQSCLFRCVSAMLSASLATKNNVYDFLSGPLISLLWMLPNYWKEIQHLGSLLCKCSEIPQHSGSVTLSLGDWYGVFPTQSFRTSSWNPHSSIPLTTFALLILDHGHSLLISFGHLTSMLSMEMCSQLLIQYYAQTT